MSKEIKFNWSIIPESILPEFKKAVKDNMKKELKKIHDKYPFTNIDWGCCDLKYLVMHSEDAIKKGKV